MSPYVGMNPAAARVLADELAAASHGAIATAADLDTAVVISGLRTDVAARLEDLGASLKRAGADLDRRADELERDVVLPANWAEAIFIARLPHLTWGLDPPAAANDTTPTGLGSHAGPFPGQALVTWTPDQLTPGYQSIVVADSTVDAHRQLLLAFPAATAGSSYRTLEQQQVLYASPGESHFVPGVSVGPYRCDSSGCRGAARPGTSNHESGLAVDYIVPPADKAAFIAEARALGALEVLDEGHVHVSFPPS